MLCEHKTPVEKERENPREKKKQGGVNEMIQSLNGAYSPKKKKNGGREGGENLSTKKEHLGSLLEPCARLSRLFPPTPLLVDRKTQQTSMG